MKQEQIRRTPRDTAGDDPPLDPVPAVAVQDVTSGLDAVLDEIDAVLETNAEEFVRNFVQKGGQ
ncbi:MAG: ubiquitin-like protein Pup [Cellulomonadaceae bacterium]|jgi:ubiquitin-like protein Pup|nr:ubiquitin-like protein Pup [Cellulomonadaceae bacterium]